MLKNEIYNPDVLNCLANLSSDEVFTPPDLVNQILDKLPSELWNDKNAKFLDPFSKSGVFLREIVKRLINGLQDEIPDYEDRLNHIFMHQVFGLATSELTSLISRRTLYCSKKANGDYSVASQFQTEHGNIHYVEASHSWQSDKCKYCGVSKDLYDRDKTLEFYAYAFIHDAIPEELLNMKFDVIIGNPPYQLNDGGGSGSSAKPIYNLFIEQAKKLNPRYLCMIIPARWYSGGKGLDKFREDMLNDSRIRSLVDFEDSRECFPGVDIAGGVCYFLWDKNHSGACYVTSHKRGTTSSASRRLNEFDTFIRSSETVAIINKVREQADKFCDELVSPRNPFGIPSKARPKSEGDLQLISSDGSGNFPIIEVKSGHHLIRGWKVFISKASYDHGGQPDKNGQRRIFAKVFVGNPNTICTESYLVAGLFDTKQEAINFSNYMRTKFARFMMASILLTQNITRDKFKFIPQIDLKHSWDDQKLYAHFDLTQKEIDEIELDIKAMEILEDT